MHESVSRFPLAQAMTAKVQISCHGASPASAIPDQSKCLESPIHEQCVQTFESSPPCLSQDFLRQSISFDNFPPLFDENASWTLP